MGHADESCCAGPAGAGMQLTGGGHMIDNRSQQLETEIPSNPNQLDFFGTAPAALAAQLPAAPEASREVLCRIGHDLRTALNAILGFSEIMTQKLHGPLGHPKYDEYAAHVRFSGQALLSVSDEVLALAGRGLLANGGHLQGV